MMIIKNLLFLSFILFTLILVSPVSAQIATQSARPNPKRQEIRVKVEEKKVERIQKLSAIRREKIMSYSNKMIVRLEATIERLEKLITRIEERITKKESLDEAKQKLALIKIDVVALKESLAEVPESDDPKATFEQARALLNVIKNGLKEVHGMLVQLIGDIK